MEASQMIVLPPCVAHAAAFADKKEPGARWSVQGVYVEKKKDRFIVAATDTKVLIKIEGTLPDENNAYPETGPFKDAPDGATSGVVPLAFWTESFQQAAKMKYRGHADVLHNIALKMSKDTVTMHATNLEKTMFQQSKLLEGRFVPFEDIIPKREAPVQISFDPLYIANVCSAMAKMSDASTKRVTFHIWKASKPMLIKMEPGEAVRGDLAITALVMPLAGNDTDGKLEDGSIEIAEHKQTIWKLEHRIQELEQELEIAKGLGIHVAAELEAALPAVEEHPPTGDEELVEVPVDDEEEDEDDTPIVPVNLEPAAEPDDVFASFLADL